MSGPPARAVRILVLEAKGSVPRPEGTAMILRAGGIEGTIGGGALEWRAMAAAREMLGAPAGAGRLLRLALGPELGQCCGGRVTLLLEPWAAGAPALRPVLAQAAPAAPLALLRRAAQGRAGAVPAHGPRLEAGWLHEPAAPQPAPVWLWGAGHVGRALAACLAPLPDIALTWADFDLGRFSDPVPPGATVLAAANPADLVRHAPTAARHLIVTHSHALDLELCHRLLGHGFAGLGMIGARTKARRFASALAALGHSPAQISRIACPLGDPALGKHPQAIAIGVAAALLKDLTIRFETGPARALQGDTAL